LRLFLRNPPAQVHIDELYLPLATFTAELWKHFPDEQITLFGKVTEGAAEENPDGAGGSIHNKRSNRRKCEVKGS
jgi:hypothetical protein